MVHIPLSSFCRCIWLWITVIPFSLLERMLNEKSHKCNEQNWIKLGTLSEVVFISAFPVLGVLTETVKPGSYDPAVMAVGKSNCLSGLPALLLFWKPICYQNNFLLIFSHLLVISFCMPDILSRSCDQMIQNRLWKPQSSTHMVPAAALTLLALFEAWVSRVVNGEAEMWNGNTTQSLCSHARVSLHGWFIQSLGRNHLQFICFLFLLNPLQLES